MNNMKKFLLTLFLSFIFIGAFAQQVMTFKATSLATANVYNGRYTWSQWERCSIAIVINLNTDIVTIYSNRTQKYSIIEVGNSWTDNSGGRQVSYTFVDQDGDIGTLRLRVESNGNSQIYIDFSNVAWVYNVIRT